MEQSSALTRILGKKIKGVRVVPLVFKIVTIFIIFLLVSNFASNYINLMMNRGALIKLMNQLLMKDLKEIYTFCDNQYEIFTFNQDYAAAVETITEKSLRELKGKYAITAAVRDSGDFLFRASKFESSAVFTDTAALQKLTDSTAGDSEETGGFFSFRYSGRNYYGMYKYMPKWDAYLIRAEELNEFYYDSQMIFYSVSVLIIVMTIFCGGIGIFLISYILRFVRLITSNIMSMQESNTMRTIDMKNAPNDEVTYLGIAFNALASNIENLMNIFKKFVARDVAQRAYTENDIRLEGKKYDLCILFSDIKSFTYMTETLGNDIIKLLNIHYDRAIHRIHRQDGIIGSIIGDALLAIYGLFDETKHEKCFQAIQSAYQIQEVAASLRKEMHRRREQIVAERGALTEAEERMYKAVLLEVGVGIDGGEVFYGNIGSYERMTNTVIGDNVNSSSRLEGLTREYKVPVIVSEYVKVEVERSHDEYYFVELDQVMVKGKTEGKRVYWPVLRKGLDSAYLEQLDHFSAGLNYYYAGDWKKAAVEMGLSGLPCAEIFIQRVKAECPKDWNGIWQMKTK